jgi:hypothetical protein
MFAISNYLGNTMFKNREMLGDVYNRFSSWLGDNKSLLN